VPDILADSGSMLALLIGVVALVTR